MLAWEFAVALGLVDAREEPLRSLFAFAWRLRVSLSNIAQLTLRATQADALLLARRLVVRVRVDAVLSLGLPTGSWQIARGRASVVVRGCSHRRDW